jgi:hypothetical protein
MHSHKVSQKYILNPAPAKPAQIQNIILNQSKRQKAKTNVASLNGSFLIGPRKSEVGKPQKELMHYIDNFTKGPRETAKSQVRTTQNSPRTLNLNTNASINRNYYK